MRPAKVIFNEFKPDSTLKDYIKSYWYFNIQTDSLNPFDILPDGYFDLLVVIKNNKIVDTRLTGIWDKLISVAYAENTEIIGVRFKPLSLKSIFRFGIGEYLNDSMKIPLKNLNLNGQILLDCLNLPEHLVNYLNTIFLKSIAPYRTDLRLKKCFELVENSIGNEPVNSICHKIGISPRQVHRLVTKMIGIGLKDYSKIVRFKKSLHDIKNNKSNYFHYYDQSHFIREIKRFTGLTPEKLDLNNNDRFIQYYNSKSI